MSLSRFRPLRVQPILLVVASLLLVRATSHQRLAVRGCAAP